MKRLLIVGIDGGTFDIILPYVKKGKLKLFKRLIEEGSWGILESTIPILTPPSWTSSYTGVNPGKHNIYDFFEYDERTKSLKVINSTKRRYPAFWEILREKGIEVALYNLPCVYPVDKVKGFIVSGMGTPKNSKGFAYPKELEDYLYKIKKGRFGSDTIYLEEGKREKFVEDVFEVTENDEEIFLNILKDKDAVVNMFVYDESDKLMHFFYHDYDETHYAHDGKSKFKDVILRYYEKIESGIEKFLKHFGDCDLIVYSDHGFGPLYKDLYVNNLLVKWNYLILKEGFAKEKKSFDLKSLFKPVVPIKLRKLIREKFFKSPLENPLYYYDLNSSKAVYTSVSGRSIIILDKEKRENIGNELKNLLENYLDFQNNVKPFKRVYKREEIYWGENIHEAPDLVIEEDGRYAFKCEWSFRELEEAKQYGALKSGSHRKEGMLILYGKSFKKSQRIENINVMDICPTILSYLGLPIGKEMDGKVIDSFVEERKVDFEEYKNIREKTEEENFEDEELKRKLKNLGYM